MSPHEEEALIKGKLKLIYKEVNRVARYYKVPADELFSQGLVLATEALRNWDPSRGAFSTYLVSRLQALSDTARKEVNWQRASDLGGFPMSAAARFYELLPIITDTRPDYSIQEFELSESAQELSQDALDLLDYVLSWDWDTCPGETKPPSKSAIVAYLRRVHKWTYTRAEAAYFEVRAWWRENRPGVPGYNTLSVENLGV